MLADRKLVKGDQTMEPKKLVDRTQRLAKNWVMPLGPGTTLILHDCASNGAEFRIQFSSVGATNNFVQFRLATGETKEMFIGIAGFTFYGYDFAGGSYPGANIDLWFSYCNCGYFGGEMVTTLAKVKAKGKQPSKPKAQPK